MSKRKDIDELMIKVGRLEGQVSCGCGGHEFALSGISREYDEYYFKFECINCWTNYLRVVNSLTEHEKKLVIATTGTRIIT